MKVLVIGNGGREHALAWRASLSHLADKVFVAPGNPGTAREEKMENVNISVGDIAGLVKFAKDNKIDLTIVGPEAPLVDGVVDAFKAEGLTIFGPSKAAAQLEGSKSFTKDFLITFLPPHTKFSTMPKKPALISKSKELRLLLKLTVLQQAKA